jgi:hypothetical protein
MEKNASIRTRGMRVCDDMFWHLVTIFNSCTHPEAHSNHVCDVRYMDEGTLLSVHGCMPQLDHARILWQMKGAWKDRVNYNSKGCIANLQAALCVRPPRSLLRGSSENTSEASADVEAPSHSSVAPVDHPMLAVLPRV